MNETTTETEVKVVADMIVKYIFQELYRSPYRTCCEYWQFLQNKTGEKEKKILQNIESSYYFKDFKVKIPEVLPTADTTAYMEWIHQSILLSDRKTPDIEFFLNSPFRQGLSRDTALKFAKADVLYMAGKEDINLSDSTLHFLTEKFADISISCYLLEPLLLRTFIKYKSWKGLNNKIQIMSRAIYNNTINQPIENYNSRFEETAEEKETASTANKEKAAGSKPKQKRVSNNKVDKVTIANAKLAQPIFTPTLNQQAIQEHKAIGVHPVRDNSIQTVLNMTMKEENFENLLHFTKPIDGFDKLVFNAYISVYENADKTKPILYTAESLIPCMRGKQRKPSPKLKNDILNSLRKMSTTYLRIDCSAEANYRAGCRNDHSNLPPIIEGNLISLVGYTEVDENGNGYKDTVFQMNTEPQFVSPLYLYCLKVNQLIHRPINWYITYDYDKNRKQLTENTIPFTGKQLAIRGYLIERIQAMMYNRHLTNRIRFDSIIDSIEHDEELTEKKKRTIIETAEKCLLSWCNDSNIPLTGYKKYKSPKKKGTYSKEIGFEIYF